MILATFQNSTTRGQNSAVSNFQPALPLISATVGYTTASPPREHGQLFVTFRGCGVTSDSRDMRGKAGIEVLGEIPLLVSASCARFVSHCVCDTYSPNSNAD